MRLPPLERVPLFSDLSPAELGALSQRASVHRFDADSIVFAEASPCRELWVIALGSVRLVKTAVSGRQQLLSIERTGGSLSEVAVFDGGGHTATAVAAEPAELLRIEASHVRSICMQNPEVALKVIKALAHRLRRMGALVEALSFNTVRSRLVAHLLRLAQESGSGTFELAENNEELAARLGTVRELISRNLGRLHGEGLIAMRKRSVTIGDLAALQREIVT